MSIPGKIIKTLGEQTTKRVFGMLRDNDKKKHENYEPSENPEEDANKVIRNHVAWSMGMGLIPVLMADIFAVSALQMDMIKQLCKIYGVDYKETEGKAIITSLTGSALARVGAASVVKLIPGIGTVAGGLTVSSFAGASTYAIGEVFKKHFSSGGTILDFDIKRLKKYYNSKFEKGKSVVKEVSKDKDIEVTVDVEREAAIIEETLQEEKSKSIKSSSTDTLIQKLKDLAELKNNGIITEEEFAAMKGRILEEL